MAEIALKMLFDSLILGLGEFGVSYEACSLLQWVIRIMKHAFTYFLQIFFFVDAIRKTCCTNHLFDNCSFRI